MPPLLVYRDVFTKHSPYYVTFVLSHKKVCGSYVSVTYPKQLITLSSLPLPLSLGLYSSPAYCMSVCLVHLFLLKHMSKMTPATI